MPYIRSESFEPNRMGEDYVDTTLAPQPTSNVVFVTDTTSAQAASETPSSPLDVTMLAMLGLTMAGVGVMKSQSAQKKQYELAQANAVAQAQLATARAGQVHTASANWEQNQTMQASATQKVYTQVQQSQVYIDFQSNLISWAREVQLRQMLNQLQGTIFDVPNELNNNVKLAVFRIKQAWDRATQLGLMSSSILLSHLPTLQSCFIGGVVNSSALNSLITTIYSYNLNTDNLASGSDEEKIALSRLFASSLHITAYLDEITKNMGYKQIKNGLDIFNQHFTNTLIANQTYPVTVHLGATNTGSTVRGYVPLHQSNPLDSSSNAQENLTSIYLGGQVSIATITHEFFHQLDRHWGSELMSGVGLGSFDAILRRIPNVLLRTENLSFSSIVDLLGDVRANIENRDFNEERWADMGMIAVFHHFNLGLIQENRQNGQAELDNVIRLGELDAYININNNKVISWTTTPANFESIENAFREFLIITLGLTGVLP